MARTVQANAVSVATTPTLLVDGHPNRRLLTFTNNGVVTVYLGGASVSTSAFLWPVPAGESVQFNCEGGDVSPQARWYGVAPSSSASVAVGEIIA